MAMAGDRRDDYDRKQEASGRRGAAIGTLLIVAAAAYGIGQALASRDDTTDCTPVVAHLFTDAEWQQMKEQGWRDDDPNDGVDILYPPNCLND